MLGAQLVRSARFVSPSLTRRKHELLSELLDQFAASVNFCIERCLEHDITSHASLYRIAYGEWKLRFGLATHWFHSAGWVATQALRSWRKLCRQGLADPKRPPRYEARTMRLELWRKGNSTGICRFQGDAVQIRIRKGEYLWLPLIVTEYHELMYLRDWREGKLNAGEPTISLGINNWVNVNVPFKHEVGLKHADGICGIDINERSVDLCVLKPNKEPKFIKLDASKLPAIRHASQLKRKSIQKKLDAPPQRPIQERRLWAKYYRREHNRTNQVLHVVSKKVVEILRKEKVEPVFENLTHIRQSMRLKRRSKNGKALRKDMRRRLNKWSFRKLQSYVEYKALQHGYKTCYLPREQVKGTSSTCPICGMKNKPNGHVFSCKACSFRADRHLVAAYNIAARWLTKDGARRVPADWRQMRSMVEELVVPAKPSMEAQRFHVEKRVGI